MALLHSERSLTFDGTNDAVVVEDVPELSFERTDPFTFVCWSKAPNSANDGVLIAKQEIAGTFRGILLFQHAAGHLTAQIVSISTNEAHIQSTGVDLRDGQWHHVIFSYDGSSTAAGIKLYLDGSQIGTTVIEDTLTATTLNTVPFTIGARDNIGTFSFDGNIDEVAVYDKELSAAEIDTIYSGGTPTDLTVVGPTASLVGYWWMGDQDTFPTIIDHSVSGNNGTMANMDALDIVVDAPRALDTNYSMLFDGVDKYVTVDNVSELSFERTDSFSLSIWFKTATITLGGALVQKVNTSGTYPGYGCSIYNDGSIFLRVGFGSVVTQEASIKTDETFANGEWHHLAMTYDGSSTAAGITAIIDGQVRAVTVVGDTLASSILNTGPFMIGSRNAADSFLNGSVTEVSAWNRELTLVETRALYNNGRPRDARTLGINSSLVGYWRMGGQLQYPTIPDLSPSGNDGTATNMGPSDVKLDAPGLDFDAPSVSTESIVFEGEGNPGWVELGVAPELSFEYIDSFSCSLWIKSDGTDTGVIVGKISVSESKGWMVTTEPGGLVRLVLRSSGATNIYVDTNKAFADSIWHHVVFTYSGTGTATGVIAYADGVPVGTTTVSDNLGAVTILNTGVATIGARDGQNSLPVGASVDNIAIYNKVLTEVEVRTLYGARGPTDILENMPLANLVGYWRMGDGDTFPTVTDLSQSGNDGTMSGALDANSIVGDAPAPLVSLYSLEFDGANDALTMGNSSEFEIDRTDPFTLMCWAKTPSVIASAVLLSKQENGGNYRGYALFQNTDGSVAFQLTSTPTDEIHIKSTGIDLTDDAWHHIAISYDGSGSASGMLLLVDGLTSAVSILDDPLVGTSISAVDFVVGARTNTGLIPYEGLVDGVAFYDRALSPSEINLLGGQLVPADHAAVGPVGALIGWWRMGDPGPAVYPTIADLSAAQNNPGTMINMDPGGIALDAPSPVEVTHLGYTYNLIPVNSSPVGPVSHIGYGEGSTTGAGPGPDIGYKMRALADPGPGFIIWVAETADFVGAEAPSAIQVGTAVVASSWGEVPVYQVVSSTIDFIQSTAIPATATDPGNGITLVRVDTANPSWVDLGVVSLPSPPEDGAEVIIKDTGANAGAKRITISGGGPLIDGSTSQVISSPRGALHVIFNGSSWSII